MRDTFEIYREWFQHHYGREFVCSREQWDEWCQRPGPLIPSPDQREIDRERREGWGYGQ